MTHDADVMDAQWIVKRATQSTRLASLMVRELRAHYREHSRLSRWDRDTHFFLLITVDFDDLAEKLEMLERFEELEIY